MRMLSQERLLGKASMGNANARLTKDHGVYDYIRQFQKRGKIAFL